MEKNLQISLLYDFYGQLLSQKQQQAVELYYNDDLSLTEISELMGITRQGVRDAVKRGESTLFELEDKLGLAKRFGCLESGLNKILKCSYEIEKQSNEHNIIELACEITDTANKLRE